MVPLWGSSFKVVSKRNDLTLDTGDVFDLLTACAGLDTHPAPSALTCRIRRDLQDAQKKPTSSERRARQSLIENETLPLPFLLNPLASEIRSRESVTVYVVDIGIGYVC